MKDNIERKGKTGKKYKRYYTKLLTLKTRQLSH